MSTQHSFWYEESQDQSQLLPFGTTHTITSETLSSAGPSDRSMTTYSSQPTRFHPAHYQPTQFLGVAFNDNVVNCDDAEIVSAIMGDQRFASDSWSSVPSLDQAGLRLQGNTHASSHIHEQGYCSYQMSEAFRTENSFRTLADDSSTTKTRKQENRLTRRATSHSDLENAPSTFVSSMALPSDRSCLTPYQLLLRQSLEYFAASQHDTEARVRGRKQKIRSGQIGVRCRYCAHLQVQHRGRGAVYYPRSLINVYQAAQNIAGAHLYSDGYTCPFLPVNIAAEIGIQKPRRDASKAGRTYWVDACKQLGIVEEDGGLWLRRSSSIGDRNTSKSGPAL